MLVPNKFISIEESVLGHLPILLMPAGTKIKIKDLYKLKESNFECIDHFIYALDILFVLEKITIDHNTGIINYAA